MYKRCFIKLFLLLVLSTGCSVHNFTDKKVSAANNCFLRGISIMELTLLQDAILETRNQYPIYDTVAADAAIEYLYKNVPEIDAFGSYLLDVSDGKINAMLQVRSFPDENANSLFDKEYYHIYVGENHPEYIVNWQWFIVNKDLDEIRWLDIVKAEYETLDEWRNSNRYPSHLSIYMNN